MSELTRSTRLRVVLITILTLGVLIAFLWVLVKRRGVYDSPTDPNKNQQLETVVPVTPTPVRSPLALESPSPASSIPTPEASAPASPVDPIEQTTATPQQRDPALTESYVGRIKLIIPVVGVRADQLLDTFADARSEGRVHDAIDIPAPAGTAVVAATDGEIVKLFQSERGGTTIYQITPDKKLMLYYAHLQRYADGLTEGKFVRQGEVTGYVGDTGNAGAGNYHLHFSISIVSDPQRYWEGTNINPYPLLRQ